MHAQVVMPGQAVQPPDPTLPPNWTTAFDAATNRMYYYNAVTFETSWVHPAHQASPLAPAAPGVMPAPTESADGNAGEAMVVVGAPVAPPREIDSPVAPPQQDAWKPIHDPASGNTYYHNTITNEVSWTLPETIPAVAAPVAAVPASSVPANTDDLSKDGA